MPAPTRVNFAIASEADTAVVKGVGRTNTPHAMSESCTAQITAANHWAQARSGPRLESNPLWCFSTIVHAAAMAFVNVNRHREFSPRLNIIPDFGPSAHEFTTWLRRSGVDANSRESMPKVATGLVNRT